MDITPRLAPGRQVIQGYGDGGFTIAGRRWRGNVLVFPDHTVPWPCPDAAAVGTGALAPAFAILPPPDLVLLGLGRSGGLLAPPVRAALAAAGWRVESMDTGAACRTFNILLTEERRVVAALIAL